jgi:16S rRNA (guanine527-N7)-methyltransferase
LTRPAVDPLDELLATAEAVGHPLGPEDRRRFEVYLDLFLRWNRTHRMTALESPRAVVRELFIDSLLFLPLLPQGPVVVVDIGAGGGIPGLPLRLAAPRVRLTLVEARRKRVSFLRAVRRELHLADVAIEEGRAEDLVERRAELAGAFDVVVARAVGPAAALLPIAFKYLKVGGLLLVSGPPSPAPEGQLEVARVGVPGARVSRAFLRATRTS